MAELAVGCVLGLVMGWLMPYLVRRVPEPPLADAGEPTYPEIARSPVSRRRMVAVAVVALGSLTWARWGEADLPAFLMLGVLGTALLEVDLRRHRLPDVLTSATAVAGVALLGVAALVGSDVGSYPRALLGAVTMGALYLVMFVLPGGGLGYGDVKLAPGLGLYLAWLGWGQFLLGIVMGFLVGGAVAILLLVGGRATAKTRIAYGPAMLGGAWISIVAGQPILDWYIGG